MEIIKKIIISAICAFAALSVFSTRTMAQVSKKDSLISTIDNRKTELDGHSFITNTLVDGPFVNTLFRLSAGAGTSSNYDVPLVINGKEIKGIFGQISYAAFDFRYQQNIKNWLAFAAAASLRGQLGSQTISAITEGIDIGMNYSLGWTFKLHESRKFMLAASLTISNQEATVFDLYGFVTKVIENGELTPDNKLKKNTNATAGMVGFKSAYAFNRTFGFLAKLNTGYGESITGKNKGYFDAGISLDADLNPKLSVPIGFALGYDWNNFYQADLNITNPQNIIFKINYTGRKDFDLGVEMNAQFFTLKRYSQDIKLEVLFVKAGIAYYF